MGKQQVRSTGVPQPASTPSTGAAERQSAGQLSRSRPRGGAGDAGPYRRVEGDAWERRSFASAANRKYWAANPRATRQPLTWETTFGRCPVNPASPEIDAQLDARYPRGTIPAWSAISRFMQARDMAPQVAGRDPAGTSNEPLARESFSAPGVDGQGYRWAALPDSELYGEGGPSVEDVVQGDGGTCFFLACLAGAVTENPQFVQDGIRPHEPPYDDNGNRLWDVRLFVPDENGNAVPVAVTVNEEVLRDEQTGNEVYAQSVDRDQDGQWELWVVLYEKAFAALNSPDSTVGAGYDAVNQGGYGDEAYFALTGRGMNTAWLDYAGLSPNDILNKLSKANPESGDVVMVGSRPVDVPEGQTSDQYETRPGSGIVAGHMYQVLGVIYPGDPNYDEAVRARIMAGGHVADGEPVLVLRNPWGAFEPGSTDANGNVVTPPDGNDDGIFCLGYYEFREHFDYLADGTSGAPQHLGWEGDEGGVNAGRGRNDDAFGVGAFMTQYYPVRG